MPRRRRRFRSRRRKLERGAPVLFLRSEGVVPPSEDDPLFIRCRAARHGASWIARRAADRRLFGVLARATEGTRWCRGWTGPDVDALHAAVAMGPT